jgi:hypothetical protein
MIRTLLAIRTAGNLEIEGQAIPIRSHPVAVVCFGAAPINTGSEIFAEEGRI